MPHDAANDAARMNMTKHRGAAEDNAIDPVDRVGGDAAPCAELMTFRGLHQHPVTD